MWKAWRAGWTNEPPRLGVQVTRAIFMAKGIVSAVVGAVEFLGAPVLERGIWGTIWAFPPRWVGMMLLMWGLADALFWQDLLASRMRRVWWYCILSSACAVPVFVVARAMPYPQALWWLSAGGAVSAVFLLTFRLEFDVRV